MKRILWVLVTAVLLILGLSACAHTPPSGPQTPTSPDTPSGYSRILVAYFSCTGTTEAIADCILEKTGGTRYEILPEVPYTPEDLKYYTGGRADREQADPSARPAIRGGVEDMDSYDAVFLGYPIWHGKAPKILYTFLESYDFSGKTVLPFCTSHSSGIGSSDTDLHSLAPDAEWKRGERFGSGASKESVFAWVDSLGIHVETEKENMRFFITAGNTRLVATLEDNAATAALHERIKTSPLSIDMRDYGGFEKVGDLGFDLPTSDAQITTRACDLVLYRGNQLVIFYGSNSWSYTRLGKITGVTPDELKAVLGNGDVRVTLNLSSVSSFDEKLDRYRFPRMSVNPTIFLTMSCFFGRGMI